MKDFELYNRVREHDANGYAYGNAHFIRYTALADVWIVYQDDIAVAQSAKRSDAHNFVDQAEAA